MSKVIMGIRQQQRHETVKQVQDLLTKYGCLIKTRLGLHEAAQDACSEQGLILLELVENEDRQIEDLEAELSKISSVVVKKMVF